MCCSCSYCYNFYMGTPTFWFDQNYHIITTHNLMVLWELCSLRQQNSDKYLIINNMNAWNQFKSWNFWNKIYTACTPKRRAGLKGVCRGLVGAPSPMTAKKTRAFFRIPGFFSCKINESSKRVYYMFIDIGNSIWVPCAFAFSSKTPNISTQSSCDCISV